MKNLIITDIPIEFIEYSLIQIIEVLKGKKNTFDGDLKFAYFLGKTLCLDTEDEFSTKIVVCIRYSEETFSVFTEGYERLLSIKAIRLLDEIMDLCKIKKERKFWIEEII